MQIVCRNAGDVEKLKCGALKESNAKQREQYRTVTLALDGHSIEEIMRMLGRSKNFVQRWNYAYRDDGIEVLIPKPQSGRPTKLPRHKELQFKQRILTGPSQNDNGVCAL
jgi:transposase